MAREAGVSRGLLHYYFGSKERLLVEVVRRDCDARIAAVEERLEAAGSVEEIVDTLAASLEAYVEDEPGAQAVLYELLSASRRSEEIRAELAELYRRWRSTSRRSCARKESEGVVELERLPRGRGLDPLRPRRRPGPPARLRSRLGRPRRARGRPPRRPRDARRPD